MGGASTLINIACGMTESNAHQMNERHLAASLSYEYANRREWPFTTQGDVMQATAFEVMCVQFPQICRKSSTAS